MKPPDSICKTCDRQLFCDDTPCKDRCRNLAAIDKWERKLAKRVDKALAEADPVYFNLIKPTWLVKRVCEAVYRFTQEE